jgi:multidrug efflux system membrane fusion protein
MAGEQARGRRVFAMLTVCSILSTGCAEESPPPEPVSRPVKAFEPGGASARPQREVPGRASPAKDVELGFRVSGRLAEFPVIEGQEVERGTVIARLDSVDYQADLEAARAIAAAAKSEYQTRVRLFEEEVISKRELERGKRNHGAAAANVRQKEKALDQTVLRAPFAGVIARRIANDRDDVRANQGIVRLQSVRDDRDGTGGAEE